MQATGQPPLTIWCTIQDRIEYEPKHCQTWFWWLVSHKVLSTLTRKIGAKSTYVKPINIMINLIYVVLMKLLLRSYYSENQLNNIRYVIVITLKQLNIYTLYFFKYKTASTQDFVACTSICFLKKNKLMATTLKIVLSIVCSRNCTQTM